jgi:sulfate permease, SulP family
LSEIHRLTQAGVTVRLARVNPPLGKVLWADGILGLIGSDHIDGNVNRALEAQLANGESTGPPLGGDALGAAS